MEEHNRSAHLARANHRPHRGPNDVESTACEGYATTLIIFWRKLRRFLARSHRPRATICGPASVDMRRLTAPSDGRGGRGHRTRSRPLTPRCAVEGRVDGRQDHRLSAGRSAPAQLVLCDAASVQEVGSPRYPSILSIYPTLNAESSVGRVSR